MSTPTSIYTPEFVSELRALVRDCPTWLIARGIIANHIGITLDRVTKLNRQYRFWTTGSGGVVAQKSISNDSFETEVETSKAATLEEVMEMCRVDSDIWEGKSFSVRRGSKGYAWNARFAKKTQPLNASTLLGTFIEEASKHAPVFMVKPIKYVTEGRLLELGVPDLHLAKLCWGQETGHRDYDIRIAADLYRKAVITLVDSARGMGISKVLLPIGNDFLNSDNAAGETTAGTPQAQSEDSRWKKTFTVACNLLAEVVERLASEFPVDVVVVGGNHDQERCFYLGQYVKAWFRNHPNVTVDNGPTQRKYYRFGTTLIGLTHGNEEKLTRLPGIMANEKREEWGETLYHEWHVGHEHRQTMMEEIGVKIRHLPSLCPPDEWMASKGYIGNDQAAEAFVYDKQTGIIASLYFRA